MSVNYVVSNTNNVVVGYRVNGKEYYLDNIEYSGVAVIDSFESIGESYILDFFIRATSSTNDVTEKTYAVNVIEYSYPTLSSSTTLYRCDENGEASPNGGYGYIYVDFICSYVDGDNKIVTLNTSVDGKMLVAKSSGNNYAEYLFPLTPDAEGNVTVQYIDEVMMRTSGARIVSLNISQVAIPISFYQEGQKTGVTIGEMATEEGFRVYNDFYVRNENNRVFKIKIDNQGVISTEDVTHYLSVFIDTIDEARPYIKGEGNYVYGEVAKLEGPTRAYVDSTIKYPTGWYDENGNFLWGMVGYDYKVTESKTLTLKYEGTAQTRWTNVVVDNPECGTLSGYPVGVITDLYYNITPVPNAGYKLAYYYIDFYVNKKLDARIPYTFISDGTGTTSVQTVHYVFGTVDKCYLIVRFDSSLKREDFTVIGNADLEFDYELSDTVHYAVYSMNYGTTLRFISNVGNGIEFVYYNATTGEEIGNQGWDDFTFTPNANINIRMTIRKP